MNNTQTLNKENIERIIQAARLGSVENVQSILKIFDIKGNSFDCSGNK